MNVIKVIPRGFCSGVVNSIKIAKDTANKYRHKNIYMIGMLVHNKHIIDELRGLNINYICDLFKSRKEIIMSLPEDSVVIFSAHGTNEDIIKLAKERNLIVIDTICEWVEVTRKLIKSNLNENKKIVFIGKNNHPETIALTSIDKCNIFMIENEEQISDIPFSTEEQILATNQTTLSILKIKHIYEKLKEKYKNIEIKNDICLATTQRQEAILNLKGKKIDLILVVGDERSSNTAELVNVGNSIGIKTIRVSDILEISEDLIKNIETLAITAGASTSSIILNKIINYLENY
ncbi:4-hydroxy-3-methylbut-2-enyl diphosphate reductase [Spiroplasma endosymbiont of Aspidapion aeneum]|uniref:4-hydroxy-3-methylbut-2-enyl diphosphate reductase n=1 Tax=Spiroplasma endosymbiont of Aspidapion aeneum TaxID=3066276 RepID=UPI00313BC24A